MNDKPNLFKRIISALFTLLNTFRKIIINLVFFTFVFIFILALTSDKDEVVVPENSALVLNINGSIVEQKTEVDPVDAFITQALEQEEENPEALLSDIIKVIKKAKNDDRISLLVLNLHKMSNSGLTKLKDVSKALEDFKASGKQIIAIAEGYTQDQYYLASYADDVWLDPKGWMILDGYGRYGLYYKSALDKLKISQHIFKVGTYKSAVEPYMRDDMSAEAKEANKLWLDDLWSVYKDDVAKQREFGIDNFDENIDDLISKFTAANSNFAQYALDNQWVDELKTQPEMQEALIALVGKGKNKTKDTFNQINFKDYLSTLTLPFAIEENTKNKDKVAVIVAKGVILNGTQKPGTIGGKSTAKLLKKARDNDQVKAVVLRVDSPGGSAYASEVIRREIDLLKASGKPVIASMGTYAASGGYWISAPADKIYASPTTITGSIGIFGLMMTFENSLKSIGISTDGVGTTDLSGFGVTRPLSDGMATLFQLSIDRGYQDFITLVSKNRNMTLEEVDAVAQGRVWSGTRAKALGLVDELGNLDDAIIAAAALAELDNYETLLVEKELSAKDKMLKNLFSNTSSVLSELGIDSVNNSSDPLSTFFKVMNDELGQFTQFNDPQGVYVYCMVCDL